MKVMTWLLDQIAQIRSGGWIVLQKKVRTAVPRSVLAFEFLIHSFWTIPTIAFVRLARPWFCVRIGILDSSRIGHFVADASIHLARKQIKSVGPRYIDIFWFPRNVSNKQWACMVRRQLFVRWWVKYLAWANGLFKGGAAHRLPQPTATASRSIYNVLHQSSARFEFSQEESRVAREWLTRHGWREGDRFVCLLVRDAAYLATSELHAAKDLQQWRYHDYRDSDIEAYVDSVDALVELGYWVIRMGKTMTNRLSYRHPKVIDYPFLEDKDDLLDIWLPANCHFFVTTGTGIDVIAWIYGRPLVYVNVLPLIIGATPIQHIWAPKHLTWKESGKNLTLREHCQHSYVRTEDYEKAGIEISDLRPVEIREAVIECEERLSGGWIEDAQDQSRQQRYWEVLQGCPEFTHLNDYIHPEARVGCAWLRSMGDAFLD